MSEQFIYHNEQYTEPKTWGSDLFVAIIDKNGSIAQANVNKTYFTIIINDSTDGEKLSESWWENEHPTSITQKEYFTKNARKLVPISITLSDSTGTNEDATIESNESNRNLSIYYANDAFNFTNIETILNGGYNRQKYDIVEFTFSASQTETSVSHILFINYDQSKVNNVHYLLSNSNTLPESPVFNEYNGYNSSNKVNNGVPIGEDVSFLYLKINTDESQDDENITFWPDPNLVYSPDYDDYNANETIYQFSITPGFGNIELTIETVAKKCTLTVSVSYPDDASDLVLLYIGENQSNAVQNEYETQVNVGENVKILAKESENYIITVDCGDINKDTETTEYGVETTFEMPNTDVSISIEYKQTYQLYIKTNPGDIISQAGITIKIGDDDYQYTNTENTIIVTGLNIGDDVVISCKNTIETTKAKYEISSSIPIIHTIIGDQNETVTLEYNGTLKSYTVEAYTDPTGIKHIIGFNINGTGTKLYGETAIIEVTYNGSQLTNESLIAYNKKQYRFIGWKTTRGNRNLSTNIPIEIYVDENVDIVLKFEEYKPKENYIYKLGDSSQKHYRFKIQYKNAQAEPIILDWKPNLYDYYVN